MGGVWDLIRMFEVVSVMVRLFSGRGKWVRIFQGGFRLFQEGFELFLERWN